MVTKEQALKETQFHYTGQHGCKKTVGPKGGIKLTVMEVRASGRCQTWKTRPGDFRLPVKYGLYESSAIEYYNGAGWRGNNEDFHVPSECPLNTPVSE